MIDSSKELISQMDKITILLGEYTTLRTEIQTRTVCMYQLIAAFAALLLWGASQPGGGWHWILLGIALGVEVIAAVCLGLLIKRDISKAARRLMELEKDINSRAGEDLLIWETVWCGEQTGYFRRGEPLKGSKKTIK